MNKLTPIFIILSATCSFAATQTSKEYVDSRDAAVKSETTSYIDNKVDDLERKITSLDGFLPASWTNGESIVAGKGTVVSGGNNVSIGRQNEVTGEGSTSFGSLCKVVGAYSHAFGGAKALGDYCLAMGLNAEAAAAYAIAIGQGAIASANNTFAVGSSANASGVNAFAIGSSANANNVNTIAVGNESVADLERAAAIGFSALAGGMSSTAVGAYASAHGLSSVAIGTSPNAYGLYSTAIGMQAVSSNNYTMSIGYLAKAIQTGALAIGSGSTSSGTGGVSIGQNAKATGNYSFAAGLGAEASGSQSIAIGYNSKATHDAAIALGALAETTASGTIRIKYGIDEIFLGFWTPKSLGDYIREMAPAPDESLIRSLAKDEVSKAKHLPMEDFYTSGSTTVQVFKTTRTVNAPMWTRYPYTAKYKIEGLTPEETGKASGGEYTLTLGTNAIMCLENGGSIQFRNGAFWAVGSGNDIFIQNPTNVMFYGAALNRENSKTLPQWIDEKMATAGSVKKVANKSPDASGNVPLTATDVGAATTEEEQATRAIVTTWEQFLDGSNVVFSITNYISGTYNLDAAKLRITELRDGVYREVYNSRDEIILHLNDFSNHYVRVALDAVVQAVADQLASKADKAWGNHTSAGGDAPSNTVYMTAPNTVFAGGMEYERVAVGEGSICVLTTKGAPVYTQGDEGTFKFQDDGGTNYFGFAKTDSYVVGCNTDGISVQDKVVTLTYDITMSGVPCIWYRESLQDSAPWVQCNTPDGSPIPGAPKVVQWDENPEVGHEVCYINCTEASGFFKATVEVAGEAKFMTNMKADLNGGVLCTDGTTVIYPHANGTWSTQK